AAWRLLAKSGAAPPCQRRTAAAWTKASPRRAGLRAYCLNCGRLALAAPSCGLRHPPAAALPKRRLLAPPSSWPPLTTRILLLPAQPGLPAPPGAPPPLPAARLRRLPPPARGCPLRNRRPRCRRPLLDADLRLAEFFPDCLAFNMFNARVSATGGRDRFVSWLAAKRGSTPSASLWLTALWRLLTPLMDCLQHLADLAAAAGHCERWLRPRLSLHDCQLSYGQSRQAGAAPRSLRRRACSPTCRVPPAAASRHQLVLRLRPPLAHWNPHCAAVRPRAPTLHPPARLHCQRCNRCVKAKYIDSHDCRSGLSAKN
uniref:Secreted protein n=1 Tax=Macrostomum lignano TaxID=282301 RepID=A0A1I8FJW0_9PLAT